MDPVSSYLSGVELNDAVAGWRANLIEGIISSGGLILCTRREVFQVAQLKLHIANHH